jgi:hypothetical protein
MASRITPRMAKAVQAKFKTDETGYFGQSEATRSRIAKFAKAMGYKSNADRTMGIPYNRAAFDHVNKIASAKGEQERKIVEKVYDKANRLNSGGLVESKRFAIAKKDYDKIRGR